MSYGILLLMLYRIHTYARYLPPPYASGYTNLSLSICFFLSLSLYIYIYPCTATVSPNHVTYYTHRHTHTHTHTNHTPTHLHLHTLNIHIWIFICAYINRVIHIYESEIIGLTNYRKDSVAMGGEERGLLRGQKGPPPKGAGGFLRK